MGGWSSKQVSENVQVYMQTSLCWKTSLIAIASKLISHARPYSHNTHHMPIVNGCISVSSMSAWLQLSQA